MATGIDPAKEYDAAQIEAMRAVIAADDRKKQEAAAAKAQAYRDAVRPVSGSDEFAKTLSGLQAIKDGNEPDMNVSFHVDAAIQALVRIRENAA